MSHERALLDTNIIIGIFAGDPKIAAAVLRKQQVFLPVPALGELYRGVFGSVRRTQNLDRLEILISENPSLDCDATTARHYGELKQALRAKGRSIPENDLWIAAIAVQHSLPVMTRDRHFKDLPGVKLDFVDTER